MKYVKSSKMINANVDLLAWHHRKNEGSEKMTTCWHTKLLQNNCWFCDIHGGVPTVSEIKDYFGLKSGSKKNNQGGEADLLFVNSDLR